MFPNTLDLTMLDPGAKADMIDGMKQWHYKLHAKRRPGAHDMEIKKVVQNGIEWSMSEVMMLNHDNMCFDIFFKPITEALLPLPLHSAPLPAQPNHPNTREPVTGRKACAHSVWAQL